MIDSSPTSSFPPDPAHRPQLPNLEIEVRNGISRPLLYTVTETAFLVGSVAGCDLRLPGLDLPPMVCLIARTAHGVEVRKLVPSIGMAVNGESCSFAELASGDTIRIATVELVVRHSGETQRHDDAALDIKKVKLEAAALRRQLYDRYRQRRDRLAGLQEAVNRAAGKVQERKRELDAAVEAVAADRAANRAAVEALAKREQQLAAEHHAERLEFDRGKRAMEEDRRDLETRKTDLEALAGQVDEQRATLERQRKQYEADLIRLDRQRADGENLQRQSEERAAELEQRFARLARESEDLEEQARQLDLTRGEVNIRSRNVAQQNAENEKLQRSLHERTASVEQQQVMLAQLRTRLERERERARLDDQLLAEQRVRQEVTEKELQQRLLEFDRRSAEFEATRHQRDEEERTFQARLAVVEEAESRLQKEHERIAAAKERVDHRATELEHQTIELASRTQEFADAQERLEIERQRLRDRESALAQAEAARETLQEQLRRRAEELAQQLQALKDREQQHLRAVADLERLREMVRQERELGDDRYAARSQDLARQASGLAERDAALTQREDTLRRNIERLKCQGRSLGAARKLLRNQTHSVERARKELETKTSDSRRTLQSLLEEARELMQRVSQWETVARAADEHVARARDRIHGHMAELHTYARQAQEDAETLRSQIQSEADHLRQQTAALHRGRDDHRLAVAAFRQYLVDWQGKVAEMKRAFTQGESRLELRQAEMIETYERLTRQSEQLDAQERAVSERRDVVERQLADMQEWYRQKLRELSEHFEGDHEPVHGPAPDRAAETDGDDAEPAILSMSTPVEPGDRKLGDLLRANELVEPDTLAALLIEARKQRRSLRQVLLASGTLTLYQLALIEAGNLDGLMVGPVRVMDRLRVTGRETVYQVYDPRRREMGADRYAVLRHLSVAELEDAVHPDEFRQRFRAVASVTHPHIAATFDVLEIQGRPAALQEWVNGLAATDWPAVFAVAGVGFRLLSQAALGLHTAHDAGVVHGHLHPSLVLLSGNGNLKIAGLGEPMWLAAPHTLPEDPSAFIDPRHDLVGLGAIARAWLPASAARGRRFKSKKALDPLEAVVAKLDSKTPKHSYPDAAALLSDLDSIGADVDPNPEAWEQLLRFVRENSGWEPAWRQSA